MPTAVITGCNSGIGLAFAQLLLSEGYHVHALDITAGSGLQSLQKSPTCTTHQTDITSPAALSSFTQTLGASTPVDVLLHIAGVMPPPDQDTHAAVTLPTLLRTFQVNAFAPLLLTTALLPNLLLAPDRRRRRVAVVSSRAGSIGDNTSGGSYAYRSSKAAVNQMFRSLAVDLEGQGVVVSMLHPGVVKTAMGSDWLGKGGGEEGLEPEVAVRGCWEVIKSKGLEETGRFWHHQGWEIPW